MHFLLVISVLSFLILPNAFGNPSPPPWVQKLIESKSGYQLKSTSTTTESPVVVYSAAVFPQKSLEKSHKHKKGGGKPAQYPYWKWKYGYGSPDRDEVGFNPKLKKGKGKSYNPYENFDPATYYKNKYKSYKKFDSDERK